jgi:ribosome-binding factor A
MGLRLLRINESIKETLSSVITAEGLKDPRIGFVTITGVETSPDLRHAKVYVSVLGGKTERDLTMKALEKARGVLQGKINASLRMKRTPQLQFLYDDTLDNALRLERSLKREAEVLGEEPHEIPVPGAKPKPGEEPAPSLDQDVDDPAADDAHWDGDAPGSPADGDEDAE